MTAFIQLKSKYYPVMINNVVSYKEEENFILIITQNGDVFIHLRYAKDDVLSWQVEFPGRRIINEADN